MQEIRKTINIRNTKKYSEIKAEELKDMGIKDIINKTTELEKATEKN